MKINEDAYMDLIDKWCGTDNDCFIKELLFEDDYGTKSYITAYYDKDYKLITIKIIRMFAKAGQEIIETKEDLYVSIDTDMRLRDISESCKNDYQKRTLISQTIDIVKESYNLGVRIGIS